MTTNKSVISAANKICKAVMQSTLAHGFIYDKDAQAKMVSLFSAIIEKELGDVLEESPACADCGYETDRLYSGFCSQCAIEKGIISNPLADGN